MAKFDKAGEWTTIDQTGDVRFHDGQRAGQSDRAHMDRATNTVALDGSVIFADAATRTTAQTATFAQGTNTLRADGHVLTTDSHPTAGQHFKSGAGARAHFRGTSGRGYGARPRGVFRKRKIVAGAIGDRGGHNRIGQRDAHCASKGPRAWSISSGGVESEAGRCAGAGFEQNSKAAIKKCAGQSGAAGYARWGMFAEDC